MEPGCTRVDYQDTGYFTRLVLDYLSGNAKLGGLYDHSPSVEGLSAAIGSRRAFATPREETVAALKQQYAEAGISEGPALENLEKLRSANTFTVTTAHQPNLLTGPLYFIYKILHTVSLCRELKQTHPALDFVPVYYMGSEDADLEELGHFTVDGKRYEWNTAQTGAVGRMKVDKGLTGLIDQLEGRLGVLPHGASLISLFRSCYVAGRSVQDATFRLVHELFGRFGVVVLMPDSPALKKLFVPVMRRELEAEFSHNAVEKATTVLAEHYKVQASGRDINLFYLTDGKRQRIVRDGDTWTTAEKDIRWDRASILQELDDQPERFSPNVILRGVFQETILPNIAFIGGGGELSYWLELGGVFRETGVPYPVLVLRNSFLLMSGKWRELALQMGVTERMLFLSHDALAKEFVLQKVHAEARPSILLAKQERDLQAFYEDLRAAVSATDASLSDHITALEKQSLKKLHALEGKLLRAEKRKRAEELSRIDRLKAALFPGGSLQERIENFSLFYAAEGPDLFDRLLDCSAALPEGFAIMNAL